MSIVRIKFMQGVNKYQPQLFTYVNIEDLIPKKHILRKLDKIFDLSFVRELTEELYCQENGRPSIDPELFFRMMLIGYIFGIKHDRRLCEEVTCNIAYRWYCKLNIDDKVPDHSSLSKIRDRYGAEIFERFFDKVVEECRINGLVKGNRVMTDASLIEADASIDSMVAKDEEAAKAEVQKLQERKATEAMPRRKITNETHISKSDPDSSLAKKEGKARALRYKVHSTIDADSRVILDSKITTGAVHDTKVYLERIEHIEKKYSLNIQEAIADRGYGAIDNIKSLNDKGITTYIPLFSTKAGKKPLELKEVGFIYDEENNKYICPEGKELLPTKSKNMEHYYSKLETCKSCPVSDQCLAKSNKRGHRIIHRNWNQGLFEQELSRMEEPIFHERLKERMWKIEGIFAEAKNMHGLNRAKYRGLQKMQIQAHMTSSVQNLKRLVVGLLSRLIQELGFILSNKFKNLCIDYIEDLKIRNLKNLSLLKCKNLI